MDDVNVAIIGCGRMGFQHAQIYKQMPGVNLVAICEPFEKRRNECAKELSCKGYAGMEDMFNAHPEIDAVNICMPDDQHLFTTELAIKHHKHILLEKPIAKELEDGRKIFELTQNYDRVFLVAHLLRYDPRFYGMKEAIDNGDLGDLIYLSLRRNGCRDSAAPYTEVSNVSMHLMIHDIDYVNWFVNCKAVKVFAKSRSIVFKDKNVDDVVFALVTYENGFVACLEACWVLPANSPTFIDDKVEVVGTKGVAFIDSCDNGLKFITNDKIVYPDTRHMPYIQGTPNGDLYTQMVGFISAITTGTKPLSDSRDAYRALTIVDAIERSKVEGKEVDVLNWI